MADSARGLGQTLQPALGPKDPTPQMSSRGSRATQQETSSIHKRLITGVDRRSVCGHARSLSSGGHISTQ